jgi:hypothetical protein
MTPEEIQLLRTLAASDVETFLPAGRNAAQAEAFDVLVEQLQRMERLGWLELKAAERPGRIGKYQRRYVAAVARCTDHGRQVLALLGEA